MPRQTSNSFQLLAFNVFIFISYVSISGCGKKNLSPPPVNPTPHDKIEITSILSGKSDVSRYRVSARIEYGNLSKRCSNVHTLEGGWVEYPHGYVNSDKKNNSIEIYRDYYQPRGECSWRLLGVSIDIYDEDGRLAGGGLPANRLQTGYEVKLTCNFSNRYPGLCLPDGVGGNRSDLVVNISIN